MGDSSRVEQDREAQRLEAQRLAQKQAEKKREGQSIEFSRLVAQKKAEGGATQARDQAKGDARRHGAQALEVRRGIAGHQLQGQARQRAEARGFGERQARLGQDERLSTDRQSHADASLERQIEEAGRRARPAVAERQEGGDTSGDRGDGQGRDDGHGQGVGQAEDAAKLVASGQLATLQGIVGVDSSQSSGGALGVHNDLQQILDEIVGAVHRSVDGGQYGAMQIELKSHVLMGSTLFLQSSREGVSLRVNSPDDEVSQLLSSQETAGALAQSLERRGVKLRSLEVNQTRVFG